MSKTKCRTTYNPSLLAVMLLFWLPALFNGGAARAEAQQGVALRLVGTDIAGDPARSLALIRDWYERLRQGGRASLEVQREEETQKVMFEIR